MITNNLSVRTGAVAIANTARKGAKAAANVKSKVRVQGRINRNNANAKLVAATATGASVEESAAVLPAVGGAVGALRGGGGGGGGSDPVLYVNDYQGDHCEQVEGNNVLGSICPRLGLGEGGLQGRHGPLSSIWATRPPLFK